jgi:hypothetical protein
MAVISNDDERARKWRRKLALVYWGLSPILFPMLVQIFMLGGSLVVVLFGETMARLPHWILVAYAGVAVACAGGLLWFIWTRVRELQPPIR